MDCSELDPDSHELLRRITRARWNPKSGIVKTTIQVLSDKTGLRYRDVQTLLEDLGVDGYLRYDREFNHIFRIAGEPPCGCEESLDEMFSSEPVGSAAYDDVPTRGDEGRGVGGGRQDSPSTGGAKERAGGRRRAHEATPTLRSPKKKIVERAPRRGMDWYVANPSELTPLELVRYFDQRMSEVRTTRAGFRSVGAVNQGALMKNFKRWINDAEVSPIQIVAMIDYFAKHPKLLKEGVPAWKMFLAKKELIVRAIVNLMPEDGVSWDEKLLDDEDPADLGWG